VHFKKSIRSTVEVYPDLLQMEIVFGLFSMNPVMITIIGETFWAWVRKVWVASWRRGPSERSRGVRVF
jgi:hypothetical protein